MVPPTVSSPLSRMRTSLPGTIEGPSNTPKARLKSMSARFTRPVMPGDELTVQAWKEGGTIRFRTLGAGGHPVLDFGTLTLAS